MDYSEILKVLELVEKDCMRPDGRFDPDELDPNVPFLLSDALADLLSADELRNLSLGTNPIGLTVNKGEDAVTTAKRLMLYSDDPVVFVEEDPLQRAVGGGWGYAEPQTPEEDEAERQRDEDAQKVLREWERRRREEIADPAFQDYSDLVPFRIIEWLCRLRPLLVSGKIKVLPTHQLGSGEGSDPLGLVEYRFDGLRARMADELRSQFTERLRSDSSLSIGMPYLRHIPIEDFVTFKEENSLAFEGLHRELRKLVRTLGKADEIKSDRVLADIVGEVDYAVRVLEGVYRNRRRKSIVLSGYDLAFLTAGLVLYGTLPEDVSRVLVTILGSATVKNVTDRITAIQGANQESPFYAAWRIAHDFPATGSQEHSPA